MRYTVPTALLLGSLCLVAPARAQVPTVQITPEKASQPATDDDQDPRDNRKTPLTPEEEMQRQIRLFDPLDRSSQQPAQGPANQPAPYGQPSYSTPVRGTGNDTGRYDAPQESSDQPLPGSLAASEQENRAAVAGPRVAADEAGAQTGEYTGPAVLSRAYSINTLSIPSDMKWHESFSFQDVYDTGLARPVPGSNEPVAGGSAGAMMGWSFGGQRAINKDDQFGFAYSGNMSLYTNNGAYNGSNHMVTVSYGHKISRRLMLRAVSNGSLYSANYAVQNPIPTLGTSIANANIAASPTLSPYGYSSKQFGTQVSLSWQQTARISYNFSGGYFGVVQDGPGLVGVTGMQAQGGVNYRYSRRTTVGLYYSYGHDGYPHGLGVSDSSSTGVSYSLAFSKSLQVRVRAGVARTETLAETPVFVAPIVAVLLGTPEGIVDAYSKTTSGDFSAQLMKDFGRNLTASVAFVRGISPGNGLLLTSTQQSISAAMSTRLFRQYTLQVSAMSQSLTSVAQSINNPWNNSYHADVAQISLSKKYRGGFSVNLVASYSYFGSNSPFLLPYEMHFGSGISWSPPNSKIWPF